MIEPHKIQVSNAQVRMVKPDGQVILSSIPEYIVQHLLVGATCEIVVDNGLRVVGKIVAT